MDDDSVTEASVPDINKSFMSAEELVSLRKHQEDSNRLAVGDKFYTHSESQLDDGVLECALENYKCTLNKKRAGRICDLMQAEWNAELNAVIVSKLKGKFVQHMGRMVNGKYALSPEESIFLLENGCIEIINGGMPMSTEEAYNLILKGPLSLEKYQVYSHLSQLGFIVVSHQTKLGVTQCKKEMNLDKHPLKKKRQGEEIAVGEPEKKRLTFTGAFSVDSKIKISSNTSEDNSTPVTINETAALNAVESCKETEEISVDMHIDLKIGDEHLTDSHSNKQNGSEVSIEQTKEDNDSVSTEINHAALSPNQKEANDIKNSNDDHEPSKEMNLTSDSNLLLENCSQTEFQVEEDTQTSRINTQLNVESAPNTEDQVRQECVDVNSESSTAQSPKDVDIMDVETDADPSEASRHNFNDFNSNINAASQDSYCAVINNDVRIASTAEDINSESNFDVLSCSSSESEDDEVLPLDSKTNENFSGDNDDEITVIGVTKKETKPLAVIELLSDEDDAEEVADSEGDDEVRVIVEYPGPSNSNNTNPRVNHDPKRYDCKKEREAPCKMDTPFSEFPDLFRKNVVCIAPPRILPSRVRPSKEAYVINLAEKLELAQTPQSRVWNSFRDMETYQQSRQSVIPNVPTFQVTSRSDSGRNSRPHRPPIFNPNTNYPWVSYPSRDFNGNMHQLMNPYRNETSFSFPDATRANSGNSFRRQHINLNMAENHPNVPMSNFQGDRVLPYSNNPPVPMNNSNPFLTGGSNSVQFMAEVQRSALEMASNMLSSIFNKNIRAPMVPNPPLPPFGNINPESSYGTNIFNSFQNFERFGSNSFSMPRRYRTHRGRPFPCQYRHIRQKRSWSDIRSVLLNSSSDSETEVPPSPREVLWDSKGICPLVRPGICHPVGPILKLLQVTQKAKVTNKYYDKRLLPSEMTLKISFDVYLPGSSYKKTKPDIPKHRIVVVRSTDPIPRYSEIASLQRKWNDSAFLQIAVVDNGDISFHSFNSISLPTLIPHL
ncbi:tRNA-splicing endonuclease subunit Sen54 [Trichonephila inaurata madagascariensis]|uniref:tRNA-splicing endonuclease subunit Sen54 n=1 Tax=Trichonephila inaurata madagascariensis TaxID=2747483 RepID=A0A8X6KDC4_9ARAC|nr:tRNA-splicing endonuclease subunit Sen54 [Trichonephila inaurata madagascariensis]